MFAENRPEIRPAFKLWFEINGKYIFGEGTCKILEEIKEKGSLSAAAKSSKMSYRYAWGLIKNVEKHLGKSVVKTRRGGRQGGKTELTRAGLSLVAVYQRIKKNMTDVCRLK